MATDDSDPLIIEDDEGIIPNQTLACLLALLIVHLVENVEVLGSELTPQQTARLQEMVTKAQELRELCRTVFLLEDLK